MKREQRKRILTSVLALLMVALMILPMVANIFVR